MSIMNSNQLWAERNRLADAQAKAMEAGDHDAALVFDGQIRQLDVTIGQTLEEEERARDAAPRVKLDRASLGRLILGPRDEFHGLDVGFRNAVADITGPTVHITAPEEYDLEIPAMPDLRISNFAATLAEVPAIGSVNYKQRGEKTGAVGTWDGFDGDSGRNAVKKEVVYTWVDAVANKETIAGYVPVSKDTLKDYDGLLDIIEHDLLIDIWDATNYNYINGTNATGITGILNTTGIQSFNTALNGDYYAAIRMMRTMCIQNARRIPTHVLLNPAIKEAIDLHKTTDGYYQSLGDDVYWGMQVIEDVSCPGILVYDARAAKRRSIHDLTVEVGYVNDQFIRNELCILAEHTKALQVTYPDAFVYADKDDIDVDPDA